MSAEVENIRDKLAASGSLSLGDLHALSGQVPGIKDFYCSSTDDTFKHMEIAEAVCASAALPVIFKARRHPMPHDLADSPVTKTRFTDGGITLTTPIRELIDPDTPPAENLILYFEEPVITQVRLGRADARPPSLAQRALRTIPVARQHLSTHKFLAHELVHGAQAHQAIEVKIKGVAGQADYSGSKGQLAIWMTQAERDKLQDHLHVGIMEHLERRHGDKTFPNLHHLLLSLDDETLRALGRFVDTIKGWSDQKSRGAMTQDVIKWLAAAEASMGGDGRCREAFAQALARNSTPPVQRMFDLLRDGPAPASGQNLHAACLREDEECTARRIAQRIRSKFIYPSMDRPLQVSHNEAALRRADEALSQAVTRAEINTALRQLESDYLVMGSKALKDLSPVVSKLRTYYLAEAQVGGAALNPPAPARSGRHRPAAPRPAPAR